MKNRAFARFFYVDFAIVMWYNFLCSNDFLGARYEF